MVFGSPCLMASNHITFRMININPEGTMLISGCPIPCLGNLLSDNFCYPKSYLLDPRSLSLSHLLFLPSCWVLYQKVVVYVCMYGWMDGGGWMDIFNGKTHQKWGPTHVLCRNHPYVPLSTLVSAT